MYAANRCVFQDSIVDGCGDGNCAVYGACWDCHILGCTLLNANQNGVLESAVDCSIRDCTVDGGKTGYMGLIVNRSPACPHRGQHGPQRPPRDLRARDRCGRGRRHALPRHARRQQHRHEDRQPEPRQSEHAHLRQLRVRRASAATCCTTTMPRRKSSSPAAAPELLPGQLHRLRQYVRADAGPLRRRVRRFLRPRIPASRRTSASRSAATQSRATAQGAVVAGLGEYLIERRSGLAGHGQPQRRPAGTGRRDRPVHPRARIRSSATTSPPGIPARDR